MKYSVLFAILALVGALLLIYTLNSIQLLDWEKLGNVLESKRQLENSEFITQTDTIEAIKELYRRGLILDYLRQNAVVSFLLSLFLILFGLIGFFHLLVDKLAYKKFYEQPDYTAAIARSSLWAVLPTIVAVLGLLNYLNLVIVCIVIVIFILCEILLTSLMRSRAQQ